MAARVLLRHRVAAPLMAATLVGGALFPSVALAEAPSPSPQQQQQQQARDYALQSKKKPIYDNFETIIPKHTTPVPSPTSDTIPASSKPFPEPEDEQQHVGTRRPTPTDRLAAQVGKARLFLYKQAVVAEDGVNAAVDRAFSLERSFTSTIASLAPPRESGEQLMPGLVYVLVASMAGSIMSRNRNILLRASMPLALGVGAGWVVIPVTMANVSDLLWTYEKRFPAVADAHVRTREGIQRAWHMTKLHAELGRDYVEEKVGEARGVVEDWVKKGK